VTMGACQSGPSAAELEAQKLADEIDKKNREEWERQQQKIKLLLLGALHASAFPCGTCRGECGVRHPAWAAPGAACRGWRAGHVASVRPAVLSGVVVRVYKVAEGPVAL
jgi:hypothetical protein